MTPSYRGITQSRQDKQKAMQKNSHNQRWLTKDLFKKKKIWWMHTVHKQQANEVYEIKKSQNSMKIT